MGEYIYLNPPQEVLSYQKNKTGQEFISCSYLIQATTDEGTAPRHSGKQDAKAPSQNMLSGDCDHDHGRKREHTKWLAVTLPLSPSGRVHTASEATHHI